MTYFAALGYIDVPKLADSMRPEVCAAITGFHTLTVVYCNRKFECCVKYSYTVDSTVSEQQNHI